MGLRSFPSPWGQPEEIVTEKKGVEETQKKAKWPHEKLLLTPWEALEESWQGGPAPGASLAWWGAGSGERVVSGGGQVGGQEVLGIQWFLQQIPTRLAAP